MIKRQWCALSIFLLIMSFRASVIWGTPSRGSYENQLKKLSVEQKYVEDTFAFVLDGMARNRLKPRISELRQTIESLEALEKSTEKNPKSKINHKIGQKIRMINNQHRRLNHEFSLIFHNHTEELKKFVSHVLVREKNSKALSFFRLGQREENRALSYFRIHHYKLAIHTYRWARSYYFKALDIQKIIIPDKFQLALQDMENLPKHLHPPQFINKQKASH